MKAETDLYTDRHASYKGCSIGNNLKHIVLAANLKQYISSYSAYQRIAQSFEKVNWSTFWGVADKYLQNYIKWFYMREKFKLEIYTIEKKWRLPLYRTHTPLYSTNTIILPAKCFSQHNIIAENY